MPAAAVIPAPVAYTNVAAVKKLVVGFLVDSLGPADQKAAYLSLSAILSWFWSNPGLRYIYFEKIRVFKAGLRLNTLAWNNRIGLWFYFVGF